MKRLGPGFELQFTSGIRAHRAKSLSENMRPLGPITDERRLIETYRQCDALLFPSRQEGFSLVPLEAMACGKPVIATHTSSLPEVVENGVTGLLCARDDIAAFVSACRKLADNPEILLAYGQAARRRAEELFSEERVMPQFIDLYRNLADRLEK
jgi:glycosyltransferase involved in cell wall biosynthesis